MCTDGVLESVLSNRGRAYGIPSFTVFAFLQGTLDFPGSGQYHATWENGKAISGMFVFSDGLPYTDPADGDWEYCRPDTDRRFYSELVNGLRPAGDSQLCDTHPPPTIPGDCWDVGDGFMNAEGEVRAYSTGPRQVDSKVLRLCDPNEEAWAKAYCRRG